MLCAPWAKRITVGGRPLVCSLDVRASIEDRLSRLNSIPLVGTTERLGDFYALLSAHFGWPAAAPPHLNRTNREAGATDDEAGRVLERNWYDLALWEHASNVLERRLAETMHPTVP